FREHFAGSRVVLEKRIQIGISAPEILPLPTEPVRAIARGGEFVFNDESGRVHAIDGLRRRHRDPQFAVLPLHTVSTRRLSLRGLLSSSGGCWTRFWRWREWATPSF